MVNTPSWLCSTKVWLRMDLCDPLSFSTFQGGEAGKRNKRILGCVENALGLREWIEEKKLQDRLKLVVTSDKQGEQSLAEKTLREASVVISQPFWPCYLDQARIDKAKKLQLAITAGVGSDHVNLEAACQRSKCDSTMTDAISTICSLPPRNHCG